MKNVWEKKKTTTQDKNSRTVQDSRKNPSPARTKRLLTDGLTIARSARQPTKWGTWNVFSLLEGPGDPPHPKLGQGFHEVFRRDWLKGASYSAVSDRRINQVCASLWLGILTCRDSEGQLRRIPTIHAMQKRVLNILTDRERKAIVSVTNPTTMDETLQTCNMALCQPCSRTPLIVF